MCGTKAVRLAESTTGNVGPLEIMDMKTNARSWIRARTFILAANAVQSAALLLRSTSKHSPAGLGNRTDMVGRGLCLRACQYVSGVLDGPRRTHSGRYSSISFTDYYLDPSSPSGMGGLIIEANHAAPATAPTHPTIASNVWLRTNHAGAIASD